MSVFTQVAAADLDDLLATLDLGVVDHLQAITEGVQNSNYFLRTTRGDWVLTLFEHLDQEQAQVYVDLLLHLHAQGLPVVQPCHRHLFILHDKPALLVPRSFATPVQVANLAQLHGLGLWLGRLHRALLTWMGPEHPRAWPWRQAQAAALRTRLTAADRDLLGWAEQIDAQLATLDCPMGGIHADLFRDNVLWQGDELALMLDFYGAGRDALWLDLAICQHDWCRDENGALQQASWSSFLRGYEQERPLSTLEREVRTQHAFAVAAALRFFLSRQQAALQPAMSGVLVKDPEVYRRILQRLRAESP